MYVKCKKHETPHASKKCGMCHSNDPKYKKRKVLHRKKQQRARQRLQASSRQAVQESATEKGHSFERKSCLRFKEMREKRRGDSQNGKGRDRVLRERSV